MYFSYDIIITPWRKVWHFFVTNLNRLYPRIVFSSLVEISALVLQKKMNMWKVSKAGNNADYRQQFFLSGKLSYTFSSGELKTFHCMSCQISARYAKVTWMPCPWPQFKKKISVMNKYKITEVHWFLAYNSNHINRLWWAKKLFTVIWLFCYYLPLEKGVTLYFWTNLNSLPHKDALCEVWLSLERKTKGEKFTVKMTMTMELIDNGQISTEKLISDIGSDELKSN